jgi:hypothetical protein
MIVAMVAVRMVEMAVHQIVDVVAVHMVQVAIVEVAHMALGGVHDASDLARRPA